MRFFIGLIRLSKRFRSAPIFRTRNTTLGPARPTAAALAVATILALSACAPTGTASAPAGPPGDMPVPAAAEPGPAPGKGRIYFYRPQDSLFPAIEPEVIVNGRLVGVSAAGESFYRDAYPGRYEIFLTGDEERVVRLSLKPGETRYVRTSLRLGFLGPRLAPTVVEADRGRREVRALTLPAPPLAEKPPQQQ